MVKIQEFWDGFDDQSYHADSPASYHIDCTNCGRRIDQSEEWFDTEDGIICVDCAKKQYKTEDSESYVDEDGFTIIPLGDKFPTIPDIYMELGNSVYCLHYTDSTGREDMGVEIVLSDLEDMIYEIANDMEIEELYYASESTEDDIFEEIVDFYTDADTTDDERSAIEYFLRYLLNLLPKDIFADAISLAQEDAIDTDMWNRLDYDEYMADRADSAYDDFLDSNR